MRVLRWWAICMAAAVAFLLLQERAYPAGPAPCEGVASPTEELRCRIAITERELHAAQANAIVWEQRLRMRERELIVLEAKAKWLSDLVWSAKQPQEP